MNPRKFVVAAYAFFCLACPQAFGAITYQILPRDGNLAPWSLDRGTITTDGTIGDISPENFESWELWFSSPSGESEISSVDGGAFLIVQTLFDISSQRTAPPTNPSLTATADQLIANPGESGFLMLFFATQDIFSDKFTGNVVGFFPIRHSFVNNGSGGGGTGWSVDNTVDSSDPINLFSPDSNLIGGRTDHPNRSTFGFPSGPLVIASVATVPEPSSVLLFAVCLSSLFFQRVVVVPRVLPTDVQS